MSFFEYTFTVFTPTYNRADTLHRVYESLLDQSNRDFEWLIIDDGSQDNTRSLVDQWIAKKQFSIRYHFQNNAHKFSTILRAAEMAKGELLLTLDSDDRLIPDALQIFYDAWQSIEPDEKEKFSAVTGLCINQNGEVIGDQYPNDRFESDSLETHLKYKISGEKCGFQKTEIMRQFEFGPSYFGNGYIPESVLWFSIAEMGYKTLYINKPIRIYFQDAQNSIMKTTDPSKDSFGAMQANKLLLNLGAKYFRYNPKRICMSILRYGSASWFQSKSVGQQLQALDSLGLKMLYILGLPFAWAFHLWRKRGITGA